MKWRWRVEAIKDVVKPSLFYDMDGLNQLHILLFFSFHRCNPTVLIFVFYLQFNPSFIFILVSKTCTHMNIKVYVWKIKNSVFPWESNMNSSLQNVLIKNAQLLILWLRYDRNNYWQGYIWFWSFVLSIFPS